MGTEYFVKNKDKIRAELLKYGAVWFRGFDLMKGVAGHREMYEALGLEPCLDPLHSSGLRKFASERDALYEEVRTTLRTKVFYPLHAEFRRTQSSLVDMIGEQAVSAWPLHWSTRRIHCQANCSLRSVCLFSKGNRRRWPLFGSRWGCHSC